MSTPRTEIEDTFNGDNKHLRSCIEALINLSDGGSLVPHGLGGHARALLASSYHSIAQLERELEEANANYKLAHSELGAHVLLLGAHKTALEKAREAGQNLLTLYVDLVNSGDAGNWNPETQLEVIRMRESLSKTNEILSRGNLEAEPKALPNPHTDRLTQKRAPDGDGSNPTGQA